MKSDFKLPYGLYYDPGFVMAQDKQAILDYLKTLHPIWEMRFSTKRPVPEGREQRQLLRPVYWLGNWQFACLDYYRPPHRTAHVCMEAEPYPPVLAKLVAKAEKIARMKFRAEDIPKGWHLNTCLINFYGDRIMDGKRIDCARVGEHKDFEPGPVASISFGERAFFQFVESNKRMGRSRPVFQQWLDDSSLQLFAGRAWKDKYFHRVQRVESKTKFLFPLPYDFFETRRINFTFRFVPDADIKPWAKLPRDKQNDVVDYMKELSTHSTFFKTEMDKELRHS